MASDVSDISNMREISEITVNTPYIFWFETFVRNSLHVMNRDTCITLLVNFVFEIWDFIFFASRYNKKKISVKLLKSLCQGILPRKL